MLFFVFSLFILCGYSVRAFMIKKLFLSPDKPGCSIYFKRFARVRNLLPLLPLACFLTLVSCGPETILLRPSLDTPYQHVDNGYKLMAYGKTDAAVREFKRAMELDAEYAPAYVGLGIVYGIKGDLVQGRALMEQAKALAKNDEQKKEVEMGFERLDFIESDKQ
jgi:tetratricopeptide (TPR) repeat protein